MIRITTALLPLALLSGCQMFAYQEPTGAQTATVTFTGDAAAQPAVCVPGSGFKDTREALAVKPWETNAFDKLFQTMKKSETVTVAVAPSDQARVGVVFSEARAGGGRDRCRVAAQFEARAGERYQAHFTRTDTGACGLEIRGQDGARADAVPVDWQCPD
ncbi:hypothetical protein LL252_01740 [Alcanivorax marinus]|uniref:Lipoprotein n=1 Tax=Alloalcanivorax marinus TaxID=1177169 RepID=A0A9Q3UJC5_9GAMM|nr:hypothetical protein [Alloalcanivorax marinus]MCC4307280.1 hypothetical protein [Alloalcanivorax marinus]MCH2558177.1 hypothetical protein [Alcanivorax sp.]